MLRKGVILAIVFLFVSGITSFSFFVSGEESIIPDWVKNNARWWADGQIAESDFISAMEYLINQGIIQITPQITEVQATKVKLSDSDRAQSIVVFMEGTFFEKGRTFYTFSEFNHFSSLIETTKVTPTNKVNIPSKTRSAIINAVHPSRSCENNPKPFVGRFNSSRSSPILIITQHHTGVRLNAC